jgi:hypothetical protein
MKLYIKLITVLITTVFFTGCFTDESHHRDENHETGFESANNNAISFEATPSEAQENRTFRSRDFPLFIKSYSNNPDDPIELTGFDTIIIEKNYPIFTNGRTLNLNAKTLISHAGRIESFPEGTTAPKNTTGRNAGRVVIVADELEGNLKVNLRGENGGAGVDGKKGATGYAGEDGRALPYLAPEAQAYLQTYCTEWIFGGPPRHPSDLTLMNHPVRGKQGGQGGHGSDGSRGHAGGDAGIIEIEIESLEINSLELGTVPGNGGPPGSGGNPGDGGPQGRHGQAWHQWEPTKFWHWIKLSNGRDQRREFSCPIPPVENGIAGEKGSDGEWGPGGQVGRIIVNGEPLVKRYFINLNNVH